VVPGAQVTVTDEHAGTASKMTSSGGGGDVVVGVVVVVKDSIVFSRPNIQV
jgi:hypothetical protein